MLKALSLWQPWASLMAVSAKMIETRSWSTSYQGLIAIHAAKKWDAGLIETANQRRFSEALFGREPLPKFAASENLPRGCFIAVGRLVDCKITSYRDYRSGFDVESPEIPDKSTDEFWFGDYSPRRFMWVFDEIWQLRNPVYARGYQGLWPLSDWSLLDEINDNLPESYPRGVIAANS